MNQQKIVSLIAIILLTISFVSAETTQEEAEQAISEAEELIPEGAQGTYYLEQAREEFEDGNYEEAENSAFQATQSYNDLQTEQLQEKFILFVIAGILIIIGLVVGHQRFYNEEE